MVPLSEQESLYAPLLSYRDFMRQLQLSPILIKVELVMQNTSTVVIQLVHGCNQAVILDVIVHAICKWSNALSKVGFLNLLVCIIWALFLLSLEANNLGIDNDHHLNILLASLFHHTTEVKYHTLSYDNEKYL